MMRRGLGPLLCELHAHTRWSDGRLAISELVDLHGRNGFDVLCITDHVVRREARRRDHAGPSVDEGSWPAYLADVEREAERARETYGMLVIAGLELTFNDPTHLAGWKTLLPTRGEEAAVVDYLRSPWPVYLARFEAAAGLAAA